MVVMGDQLNFIIDHQLESGDAFDAILSIMIGSHKFTELSTFLCPGRTFRIIWFLPCLCIFPCVQCHDWFSHITLCKSYYQSSRRLSVSETSSPCGLIVHINSVIACFVQASDDRLLKMRIDNHYQQLFRLINRLFPIIGISLVNGLH